MNIRFVTVHDRHVAVHEYEIIGSIQILTVVSKVGMEVPRALESIPDLLELCTTDLVIVNLLGHLI